MGGVSFAISPIQSTTWCTVTSDLNWAIWIVSERRWTGWNVIFGWCVENLDASYAIATHVLLAIHVLFVNILLTNLLIAMFRYVESRCRLLSTCRTTRLQQTIRSSLWGHTENLVLAEVSTNSRILLSRAPVSTIQRVAWFLSTYPVVLLYYPQSMRQRWKSGSQSVQWVRRCFSEASYLSLLQKWSRWIARKSKSGVNSKPHILTNMPMRRWKNHDWKPSRK